MARKRRIIKLTEQQLLEAEGLSFEYLSNGNCKAYNGQSEISANGKLNSETNGEPVTSDDVESQITPQGYIRYTALGGYAGRIGRLREEEQSPSSNDANGDGVDDFYNNKELDTLNNGLDDDNLTKIPNSVEHKLNTLIDAIRGNNLAPKQIAIIMNKMIESFDITSIPNSWKKELKLKIK